MTIKVAINGYGRIGRNILRALYEGQHKGEIKIVGAYYNINTGAVIFLD